MVIKNNLNSLDVYYRGKPFSKVRTKNYLNLNTLDIYYRGKPFTGANQVNPKVMVIPIIFGLN